MGNIDIERIAARALALFALATLAPPGLSANAAPVRPASAPQFIAGVSTFDIASAATGRTYRIGVFRPLKPPPPGGYPVMYVTDGDLMFDLAATPMRVREFVDVKPAVIVGITYPTDDVFTVVRLRMRDLIPDPIRADFMPIFKQWLASAPGATVADAGGAEAFYHFITAELRPRIAASLRTDAGDQALYGRSLGGLFTLHVLFNHPAAFHTYIVSSPSILVNTRAIVAQEPRFREAVEHEHLAPRLLLLAASEENYPSSEAMAAMSSDDALQWAHTGRAVDNVVEMAARLRKITGGAGYEVHDHVFEGENHLSVIPGSVSRALTFAFGLQPPGS